MPNKIAGLIFNKAGVPKLNKYLDLSSVRQKLISGNISNSSTPGYKSKDIDFQNEYNKAVGNSNMIPGRVTHRNHIPLGNNNDSAPKVEEVKVQEGDLNSIDIDKEISTLALNELKYTVGATLLQQKFDALRKAISSR